MKSKFRKALFFCLSLTLVFSFVSSASASTYKINLDDLAGEKEVQSRVTINLEIGNKKQIVTGNEDSGYPYLISVNGGGVTYVPIRLICDALSVNVKWIDATSKDSAHAVIATPEHGTVSLYLDATSITASDGTTYKEETYKFPDNSLIPLCLSKKVNERGNRIYVPLRFISTFLLENPVISWANGNNGMVINIKAEKIDSEKVQGVNSSTFDYRNNKGNALLSNMPNTLAVAEKYSLTAWSDWPTEVEISKTGCYLRFASEKMVEIEGISSSEMNMKFEIIEAMVNDVIDSESATQVNELLEEYKNIIDSDNPDMTNEIYQAWRKEHCDKKIPFGNVTVTIESTHSTLIIETKE